MGTFSRTVQGNGEFRFLSLLLATDITSATTTLKIQKIVLCIENKVRLRLIFFFSQIQIICEPRRRYKVLYNRPVRNCTAADEDARHWEAVWALAAPFQSLPPPSTPSHVAQSILRRLSFRTSLLSFNRCKQNGGCLKEGDQTREEAPSQ